MINYKGVAHLSVGPFISSSFVAAKEHLHCTLFTDAVRHFT